MNKRSGFTIVELLVVIVVIGVLAAITIVSYSGISRQAIAASIQSDLSNASKELKLFNVTNGSYPTTSLCSMADSPTNKCLKTSSSNKIALQVDNSVSPQTFYAEVSNGSICYSITENSKPTNSCLTPPPTVTIGTQTWMQSNMNTGTKINTPTASTNNGVLQKYCYNNLDINCTNYGALYQWDEMMNYTTVEGAQGICPFNFHIPTRAEWTTLVGAVAVDQLINGGSTGFNALNSGGFNVSYAWWSGYSAYWTSYHFWNGGYSRWDANRYMIDWSDYSAFPNTSEVQYGHSVRCIRN